MAGDVIELVELDHREIRRLIDQSAEHPARRPLVLPTLSAQLIAHDRAEEETIYPVAREVGGTDIVARCQHEHLKAEELLLKLTRTDFDDAASDMVLTQLGEMFAEHVRIEETELIPLIRDRIHDERLAELEEAFVASRTRHYGERPDARQLADLLHQAGNIGLLTFDLAENELKDLLTKLADE